MRRGSAAACLALVITGMSHHATAQPREATPPSVGAHGEPISNNDNRIPAGELRDGVLTVRLEARSGVWYPEGPRGLGRSVAAFAEAGRPLQNPGPLIRVPAGTQVVVTVRNTLSEPLTLHGLGQRRGIQADSVRVEPGEVREMRFTATEPGTYWYAGRTVERRVPTSSAGLAGAIRPAGIFLHRGPDSQLNGALVVEAPGTESRAARDRVFLISWAGRAAAQVDDQEDPATVMAINGASWPHTERFDVMQGDSLHWRWINMTAPPHPMHLHGFYFSVNGKGDGARFEEYASEARRSAVTETIRSGETMHLAWSPSKPGNWIFHCHIARHMSPQAALMSDRRMPAAAHPTHGRSHSAGAEHMAKLVLGIIVRPRGETAASSAAARPIRLLIRSGPRVYGEYAGYGYVLGGSPEEADPSAFSIPGPTLVLTKDEPVEITLVNQSHEPAAVHWHGIELDSYPDGVPGWSGDGASVLPAVAPGDSLPVRFTPPRAGTFMYHSHFNEHQQISSGLYGAIIVRDSAQRFDPDTDRVLLFSDGAPTADRDSVPIIAPLLNGRQHPAPLELRAGVRYRLRLINIRSDFPVMVAVLDTSDRPIQWRRVAKDGAELPPAQATAAPAQLIFLPGEIHDVELTLREAGELRLRFGFPPRFRPERIVVPDPVTVTVRVQ